MRDAEALGEALKKFFGKHKLPKRNVRIGVANNRIGVRTLEVAGIDDPKQLANAVRFRAQEALPIPIDEAVLDFQILGDGAAARRHPVQARPSRRRVSRPDRRVRRGLPSRGSPPGGRRPRGLRTPARPDSHVRDRAGRQLRAQRARRGLHRLRTQRRSVSRTATAASTRACSTGAATRSPTPLPARSSSSSPMRSASRSSSACRGTGSLTASAPSRPFAPARR